MDKAKKEKIRYIANELIEKNNLDSIDACYTASYSAYSGEKKYSGHSFLKRFSKQLHSAVSNLKVVDIKFLAEEGNTITWQRTLSGIHKDKMRGIPASGKKLKWIDMIVSRFDNGKISEEWVVSELMGEMLLKASKA